MRLLLNFSFYYVFALPLSAIAGIFEPFIAANLVPFAALAAGLATVREIIRDRRAQ